MTCPPYQPHPPHRDRSAGKSQWTIPEAAETVVFERAWDNGWVAGAVGWGIYAEDGEIALDLGISDDGERSLWWAKFVGKTDPWHGYPADLVRRQEHDAPAVSVARAWHEAGHIDKVALSRIIRKQPCRPS